MVLTVRGRRRPRAGWLPRRGGVPVGATWATIVRSVPSGWSWPSTCSVPWTTSRASSSRTPRPKRIALARATSGAIVDVADYGMRRRPFLPCAEGERNDVRRAGVSEVPPVEARDLARGHERDRDEGIPNTPRP